MYIKDLSLVNFRNYSKFYCDFNRKYNFIYGKNAQGKTNILEAIFLCSSGRSHRTKKDAELVKFDEDAYFVHLNVNRIYGSNEIEFYYSKFDGKKIKINNLQIKKSVELMGKLNTVMFSPEDLSIIKGSPSERRRYIDIAISQMKPSYYYNLQKYAKILSQRNHLLKDIGKNRNKDKTMNKNLESTLEIWNESLAETGARIINERKLFIENLNGIIKQKHEELTAGNEKLDIQYHPSIRIIEDWSLKGIKDSFLKNLKEVFDKEIKICNTLIGPQRDDINIFINGSNVKLFGSQGQQRTVVLSLKLSEVDIVEKLTGELPVLLLDDVLSELDEKRQKYLLNNIKGIQVFITTTEKEIVKLCSNKSEISLYEVDNGRITSREV